MAEYCVPGAALAVMAQNVESDQLPLARRVRCHIRAKRAADVLQRR